MASSSECSLENVLKPFFLAGILGCPPCEITSEEDHTIDVVKDFADRITRAASPGAYWVEFLPWMRHIPPNFDAAVAGLWIVCRCVLFVCLFVRASGRFIIIARFLPDCVVTD